MTPEGKVKAKIKSILKDYGVWYTMPVATGYGRAGVPDFLLCFRGRFIAVEAKAGGNAPTVLQQGVLAAIAANGGLALVITDANLHELEDVLCQLNSK